MSLKGVKIGLKPEPCKKCGGEKFKVLRVTLDTAAEPNAIATYQCLKCKEYGYQQHNVKEIR